MRVANERGDAVDLMALGLLAEVHRLQNLRHGRDNPGEHEPAHDHPDDGEHALA